MKDEIVMWCVIILFTLYLLFGMFIFPSIQCYTEWKDSGMNSKYSITSGCMIQRKDNTWVPAKSFRVDSP